MRRVEWIALIVLASATLTSCAPESRPPLETNADPAGFWLGLWHGFITLFTFVVSLFKDGVAIYEANNSGGWYDFGFLLGVLCFWGGGSGGACCGKKD